MEFNQEDRSALYDIWMSQKAKMHLTQMGMAKRLGLTQTEFSDLLRGSASLSMNFINQFCQYLHVEPRNVIPSLKAQIKEGEHVVYLHNKVTVDGEIQNVYVEGNQVIIEYAHRSPAAT